MANANASPLPPPSPEHRRIAVSQFEHANHAVASGGFDYGIRLLLSCCKLDPANLIYRQTLRRTTKAKYQNNLRGSWLSWLTTWPGKARIKNALRTRDYLKVLEYGENVLARNPWDVGAQVDMAEAAVVLGLLDLAVWILEQARQKQARDPALNRALAQLYEKRGNFREAMALWELVRKARPADHEAQHKLKDLAVNETIVRGNYEEAMATGGPGRGDGGAGDDEDEAEEAAPPPDAREAAPAKDRVSHEAAPIRARLQAEPTNPTHYLQIAALFRRAGQFDQARAVLQQGLGPTGNAFELSAELIDLDIEPFRRNLLVAEEKCKADPKDEAMRKLRIRLRKEINTRELEYFRQKADRFPGEMSHRFEVGVRLLRGGLIDEAIRELQLARNDPRCRWQAVLHLGHCFKARNNWKLAQRNFEEALQLLPATGETTKRKEVLFLLAQGCAESGDLVRAVDLGNELANLDFGYRDIGRLLDDWQARLDKANVSP